MTDKPEVTVYSDGGADPNPGPGGWGVVLLFEKNGQIIKREMNGGDVQTTNNRMELTAAIEALRALKQSCRVNFYTDSQYVKKGITEWMAKWQQTNFKKGTIQNVDLWQLLNAEVARHDIHWNWVKGHAGNEYNEIADRLATAGRGLALGEPLPDTQAITITDGVRAYLGVSGSKVNGPGSWAVLIEKQDTQTILSGGLPISSSNQLYLMAAIAAVEAVPSDVSLQIFTNSSYIREGIRGWVKGWKKNGWVNKEGEPVKNRDLWEKLDRLADSRQIQWTQIEGKSAELDQLKTALKEALT